MSKYHKGFDSGRLWGETPEEEMQKILEVHPIEFDEKINTLDRPLILENAYPGWQSRVVPSVTIDRELARPVSDKPLPLISALKP